jgi:hypothetical protein
MVRTSEGDKRGGGMEAMMTRPGLINMRLTFVVHDSRWSRVHCIRATEEYRVMYIML